MPDPIAPYFPTSPMPAASNEARARATADAEPDADAAADASAHAGADANAGVDAGADAPPDAQANTGWHRLPAELVAHVGSFLPWQALDALRLTHKRTHQALASSTVTARIGWRIACVSSLSMLRYTVRALRDPLLSDANRANALCALAERLPRLDGDVVAAARDVLLERIARLPAPLRAQPPDRCHAGPGSLPGSGLPSTRRPAAVAGGGAAAARAARRAADRVPAHRLADAARDAGCRRVDR
ncbi:hypothetical protein [Cupriavidus sp. H18C1]|uniref:hypothetical protein n=1 Tax=Cupriavidus sp. H18C1 TaxID=3241601 RepID=UPI003BB85E56